MRKAIPLNSVHSLLVAAGFLCAALSVCAPAQTVTTLYGFSSAADGDGAHPDATPVQGRDGELYGTTYTGGPNTCTFEGFGSGCGSLFKIDTAGNFTDLHDFAGTDGAGPEGVILASDGNFYGSTYGGGANGLGVLFKVTSGGVFTKLHDFANGTDGEYPADQLLQASDGNLYGVSRTGLYRATTSGTVTTLFTFSKPLIYNGIPLIQATNGYLYATFPNEYYNGTTSTCGAFVKFSLQGSKISEHDFGCLAKTGDSPPAAYIQGPDGNFYGTNSTGGTGNGDYGTAATIDAHTGLVTLLHDFDQTSGAPWNGLTLGTDGNFYGMVVVSSLSASGAAYQLTPGGDYTELAGFPNIGENYPVIPLMQHTDGKFYSVDEQGEFADTFGSVYVVDNNLAPFITFVTPQGRVGSRAQILGQGLTGATSVTFNGVTASSFTVVSDTFMTAVVPAGATSGSVVVTTPSGTFTSNKGFRISAF